MKRDIPLTREQQELVEANLSVVYWVITETIHVNETVYGLEYDDLYQEGCIWLCHAASTYDPACAQFSTYAKKVVRNGLISYCRQMCSRQGRFCYLTTDAQGKLISADSFPAQSDNFKMQTSMIETLDLLASAEKDYQGVARLGIEALKWKIKGMSVTEIAGLYNVPSSHVGAWISRAAWKLRKNPLFMSSLLNDH